LDIEVNYRNKRRYKTGRVPLHPNRFWMFLVWLLSKMTLMGKDYKVERVGMEDLKPPYMLLSNHMHFVDFKLAPMATFLQPVSNVVSIDGYINKFFLLEWIGSISTRRFTLDLNLVKTIRKVLKRGDVLSMYPEARYCTCGIPSYIPDSLGKLVKMNKVPVVIATHRGNHLHAPIWNFRNKRKVPLRTTMKLVLTPEQITSMSVDEINALIKQEMTYDEYRYQKDNGILIKEPYRAEGLHKALYQCPHCGEEFKMGSKGTELFCEACGKRWNWNEDGYLQALEGETEFDHIPDWYLWQRTQVEEQIRRGEYSFSQEVEVFSLPRVLRFIPLGKAILSHDPINGFELKGHYRNKPYYIHRRPEQNNSVHVEYDYGFLGKRDCIDISTENDSFYCYPSKQNVITKLAFATEAIYQKSLREKRNKK
jgi:hypothetical protein